jgi:hypothetical protein
MHARSRTRAEASFADKELPGCACSRTLPGTTPVENTPI